MIKSNKVISFVLSVLLLLNAFVLLPATKANAVSQTREEAVNWANSQIGKYIDVDGAYGNQCVDLIMAYYQYLGVSRVSGHGYQYATNALPSGWTRIQNTPTFVPEPGDIVVWNTSIGGGYGHVAIFISGDTSSFVSIDQNWPKGTSCQKVTHNYNSVWGVVRPDFSASVPPSNPTISKDQVWYDLEDTIEITAYADNATTYWMSLFNKDGNLIINKEVPSGKFTFDASQYGVGDYSVYFSCCNGVDYIDTPWLDFSIVGSASYSDVYVSNWWYDLSDTVSITVSSVCAKGQVIGIDKEGVGRVITAECNSTYTIAAKDLGIGKYSAYFSVYNNGSPATDTERVFFEIVGEPKPGAVVKTSKENYKLSDDVKLSVEVYCSDGQLLGIDKEGVGRVLTDNMTNCEYIINASSLGIGKYSAYCSVYNGYDGYDTERVYFNIDNELINPQISLSEDVITVDDTLRLGVSVDGGADYYTVKVFDSSNKEIASNDFTGHYYDIKGEDLEVGEYSVKVICSNLAFSIETDILTFEVTRSNSKKAGDINSDDVINMKDIVLLQQYMNNWDVEIDTDASDVNNDGVINMKDIVLLQQYMNGWDVALQ